MKKYTGNGESRLIDGPLSDQVGHEHLIPIEPAIKLAKNFVSAAIIVGF